ncbi:MAG: winged helix-turn-helix transcriptional regulator [Candidatus Thermoplasmatota archaeon]|nr:winged helix-turn-helix transcriptional regulator [Candidatus Thermoplasmatota archaeon]
MNLKSLTDHQPTVSYRNPVGETVDISSQILRYVSRHPGSSFSEIMDSLGLSESTLRYHLERFERKGVMVSRKIGVKRCYFTVSDPEEVVPYGLSVLQRRVLKCINYNPRISRKDIVRRTNIASSSVAEILTSLVKKGKIVKIRVDGRILYEYVSRKQLKERVFKLLVIRLVNGEIDEHVFNELVEELDRKM